jgi:hypothetical protein
MRSSRGLFCLWLFFAAVSAVVIGFSLYKHNATSTAWIVDVVMPPLAVLTAGAALAWTLRGSLAK